MTQVTIEIPDWVVRHMAAWLLRRLPEFYQGEERNDQEQAQAEADLNSILADNEPEWQQELAEQLAEKLFRNLSEDELEKVLFRFHGERWVSDLIFGTLGYL